MKKVLVFVVLLNVWSFSFGQVIEAGPFVGAGYYLGDINHDKQFGDAGFGYGFLARYNFDDRWGVRIGAYRGKLSSSDKENGIRPVRDAWFEGDVTDLSLVMELNFLPYFTGSRRSTFSPFIFGGIGYHFMDGENRIYNNTATSYSNSGLTIPFGIGAKYSLTKTICLAAEWGMRKTFNDQIDGLQEFYPQTSLESVQLSNASTNDWYSFAGISLTFKFNLAKKYYCPDQHQRQ
ncbi:MAG: DUF6089 family protein [Bacteroidota bacterium]|nr:DUF6089 family protein [Bacteroidota bacterium]